VEILKETTFFSYLAQCSLMVTLLITGIFSMVLNGWNAYDILLPGFYFPHAYNVVMFSVFYFVVLIPRFRTSAFWVFLFVYSLSELSWSLFFFPELQTELWAQSIQLGQAIFVVVFALSLIYVWKKRFFKNVQAVLLGYLILNFFTVAIWYLWQVQFNWEYHLFYLGLMYFFLGKR